MKWFWEVLGREVLEEEPDDGCGLRALIISRSSKSSSRSEMSPSEGSESETSSIWGCDILGEVEAGHERREIERRNWELSFGDTF